MEKLANALRTEDYQTVNSSYPSREHTIEVLAKITIPPTLRQCSPNDEIYFVTHSLGGILVRQYLAKHAIPNLRRVVMLGSPNKGSEVVET